MRLALFALLLVAAACGGSLAPGSSSVSGALVAPGALPVLSFDADWTVTQSAPLVAGRPALLRYALDRLPACRGPGWGLAAFFQGEFSHRHDLHHQGQGSEAVVEIPFTVPFGREFKLWFQISDSNGCHGWDSNFGGDHVVRPVNPPASIHFAADWSTRVRGTLEAGEPIAIDFDLWRIPFCNASTTWDTFTGEAHAFVRWDDGFEEQLPLFGGPPPTPALGTPPNPLGQMQVAPVVVPSHRARSFQLWFHGTSPLPGAQGSCSNWDSAFGSNYRFELGAPDPLN
jgi:hypothetical protein